MQSTVRGIEKNFQLMYQKLDARHFLKNMVSKGQDNLVKYEFLSWFYRQVIEAQKSLINDLNSPSFLNIEPWFKSSL